MPQTGIVRLFTSSKMLVVFFAMVFVFVLELLKLDSTRFVTFITVTIPTLLLTIAGEDSVSKLAARPRAPAPSPVTINNTVPPPASAVDVTIPGPTTIPIDWSGQ